MQAMTDVIRRVYIDGYFLEVGPWPEVPGFVALQSTGVENEGYFGKTEISMSPDFAEQLGRALIAAAEEARQAK